MAACGLAIQANASTFSESTCFKLNDSLPRKSYTLDVAPMASETFSPLGSDDGTRRQVDRGCRIQLPARLLCVPTETSNAREIVSPFEPPSGPGPSQQAGGRAALASLCYRLRCREPAERTLSVIDLYGFRDVTIKRDTEMLCVPATHDRDGTTACVDSDGGANTLTKGAAVVAEQVVEDACQLRVFNGTNEQYNLVRSCSGTNCFLDEALCRPDSIYDGVRGLGAELIPCPHGCNAGACAS